MNIPSNLKFAKSDEWFDPASGAVLASYPLDTWIVPGFFTFYGDRMVTLDYEPGGMVAKRLLLFDAPTMMLIKAVDLPSDPYGDKVIVSPDGSKLYVERGYMSTGGATIITIFDGATLEVLDTLEIPGAQPPRRGARKDRAKARGGRPPRRRR